MPGLLRGVARTAVVAGTASTVAGRVQHRQQQRWAQQEQPQGGYEQQPVSQQAPPSPAAPAGASVVDQLKDLADLKTQGILTDEEFAAQKAKILNS